MNWWRKTLVITAFFAVFSFIQAVPSYAQTSGAMLNSPNEVIVQGTYAYVLSDGSDALEIIDISNPALPLHKGAINQNPDGNHFIDPQSFAVSGNYAYLGNYFNNSFEIIDVSDPSNPVLVKTVLHGDNGLDLRRINFVKISGNYLFLASSIAKYLQIFDISDPVAPVHLSSIFPGSLVQPLSLFVSGDYLYYTYRCLCNGGGGFRIFDISNPAQPVQQGSIDDDGASGRIDPVGPIYVSSGYAYFGENTNVRVANVSDPLAPVLVGKISNGDSGAELISPWKIFIEGNYLYITSYGNNALEIIDISDPTNPAHAGVFHFEGDIPYPFSVVVSGSYAFVTLRQGNALEVVDISDPANPVRASIIRDGELVGTPPPPARNPVLIVPGVLGTEIFKGSEELWLNSLKTVVDIGDQFLDPLQFNTDLTPSDLNLSLGNVIREKGISSFTLNYTKNLITELENQGYILDTDLFLFPYDWRYGVQQNNIDALKQRIAGILAFTDAEKVDVIAHSTGGLLVKKYVMNSPSSHNIDRAVFVGVPNTGAPKAIKALLTGDHFGNPFLALSEMKKIAKNLPVVYDLSPSKQYYDRKGSYVSILNNPLFGSDTTTDLSFDETNNFLINDHGMNSQAISNADSLHSSSFDDYDLRTSGIDLYSVVGCKAGTIGKITERRSGTVFGTIVDYLIGETPGDGTVPLESATNLPIDPSHKYYSLIANHASMMTQEGSRQQIVNIIAGSSLTTPNITQDVSECELNGKAIEIFSPLSIDVIDQQGNHSGLDDDGNIFNDIPNADFEVMEDHKFVYLPTDEGQQYTINLKGTGAGTFTLRSSDITSNEVANTETFSDVPVTTSLKGNLDLENSQLVLDTNGDGATDETIAPDGTEPAEPSLTDLLTFLKEKIQTLSATDKVKQNLLKRIDNLEKKIEKKKTQNAKVLERFKNKISKQELKGKIASTDANAIIELLILLEAQSDTTALDTEVLEALKTKIRSLNMKQNQKNDLLKRVERLENKQRIIKTLDNFTANIAKKNSKGKLTDQESQQILDLLTQIEGVI